MILSFFVFLPFYTCIVWSFLHWMTLHRTEFFPYLMALTGFAALSLFTDSCFTDRNVAINVQVVTIIISQGSFPCIVPLVILYLRKLRGISSYHPLQMMWIIAPAALLTSALLLFFASEPGSIESTLESFYANGFSALSAYKGTTTYLFYISTFVVYRVILFAEVIWLFIYLIIYKKKGSFRFWDLRRFFFKGGEIRVTQLQTFNISLLFLLFILKTPIIKAVVNTYPVLMAASGAIMFLLVFWFSYIALFGSRETIRISQLREGWVYNYNKLNKGMGIARSVESVLKEADEQTINRLRDEFCHSLKINEWKPAEEVSKIPQFTSLSERVYSVVPDSWDEERLLLKLQKLIIDEEIFLQPRLTLVEVAERLDSNTSYVSRLVNNAYNLGFPEFINTLRIDYSQQYILNHREAKQEEIASKCGFLSASSFNNTFKRITGVTPKVWVAGVDGRNK